jgi:hypothetical protein
MNMNMIKKYKKENSISGIMETRIRVQQIVITILLKHSLLIICNLHIATFITKFQQLKFEEINRNLSFVSFLGLTFL